MDHPHYELEMSALYSSDLQIFQIQSLGHHHYVRFGGQTTAKDIQTVFRENNFLKPCFLSPGGEKNFFQT